MTDTVFDRVRVKTKTGEDIELNECSVLLDCNGAFLKASRTSCFVPFGNIDWVRTWEKVIK